MSRPEDDILAKLDAMHAEERRLSVSLNAFATELISKTFTADDSNKCISPASIYFALAMVALGAKDGSDVQRELLSALGHESNEELIRDCDALYDMLCSADDNNDDNNEGDDDNDAGVTPLAKRKRFRPKPEKSIIANALWVNEALGYSVSQQYAELIARIMHATANNIDFTNDSSAHIISDWTKERTDGFMSANAYLAPDSPMSISNLMYYRGKWYDEFNPAKTAPDIFHAPDGDIEVDFMHDYKHDGHAYRGDGYTYAEKHLGHCKMAFILPDEDTDITMLTSSPEKLEEILSVEPVGPVVIKWAVPKFDISTNIANLSENLQELGIKSVFAASDAFGDILSGMDADTAYVSDISHETRFSIDEEGCEAAALTVSHFSCLGMITPKDEIEFKLDRPFIFALLCGGGNAPLFFGIVSHP